MVHIVQSKKSTTPYGRGKNAGNVYYEWPDKIPGIGVTVTQFPESNFDINLSNYEAYDSARLPFVVDVVAFFRVDNAEVAAQRIASFPELKQQLVAVLQGSVRRILATNPLEDIMQERSMLGKQFTEEVKEQIKEWGVIPVKTIEFMDLKDSKQADSTVIANIMAKEQSRIEMQSRIIVAENSKNAQLKEIDAKRTVEVQKQDAEQLVGQRTAEKDREVGISEENSKQKVLEQSARTAELNMAVALINEVKQAEINKEVTLVDAAREKSRREIQAEADKNIAIIKATGEKTALITQAEGEKTSTVTKAEGKRDQAKLNAEGIRAEGEAAGDSEHAILMAPVNAQISLAKEIGSNEEYQTYLISVRQLEAAQQVGIEIARALQKADIKVISNAGDPQAGISKIGDLFSTTGGTNLTGMLSALAQTEEGQKVLSAVTGKVSNLMSTNTDNKKPALNG